MGLGLASWNFLLQLLLLLCVYRTGARELKEEHAHHSSHVDVDPSKIKIFFTLNDLKLGEKMPLYFPKEDHSHFLPKEEADSIPFSLNQLPYLLELISIPHDSPQAKAMEETLRMCESDPIKGEIKTCATSLESMFDFSRSIFGSETDFKAVTTKSSSNTFQNFTILQVPEEIPAPKMVACHYMSYPYAIYGCHSQMTMNKVFKVSLLGDNNGDKVDGIAVCHMDTSEWDPNHLSFKMLGIKPGTSPICHYLPTDNLVFVPVLSVAKDDVYA